MQGKNIKIHLEKKIKDWANSITDNSEVRNAILRDTIVTGGAIVSLLLNEDPHDYDIYFKTYDSLKLVAEYYVDKYNKMMEEKRNNNEGFYAPKVFLQSCEWNSDIQAWIPTDKPNTRLRVFIRSVGAVSSDDSMYEETYNCEYEKELERTGISEIVPKEKPKTKALPPYRVKFMSNNAITLSDKIQIVLRFYGTPSVIHENYDFVHCTSYYLTESNKLVMPERALEAILNKELYYIGSKYPLCSIVRTRKFINRGWTINAGQYVKMALQLNELDLCNLHVFEEQLVGVDSAYFTQLIREVRNKKATDESFTIDSCYLIDLVNKVFDK